MDTKILYFHLSDNEQVVRNFECTRIFRFFATPTMGYLTVTNRRIVYHSQSRSVNGTSAIISELPLDDVSGLSTSVSASFNWLFFILFCAGIYLATTIASMMLPSFLTGWVVAILLVLPYLISLLFVKNILSQEVQEQFLKSLGEIPGTDFLMKRSREYYMTIFQIIFYFGLALVAWNIVQNSGLTYDAPWLALPLLVGAYYLIYQIMFGRIRTFSLSISSKASRGSGIIIPGNPISLLFGGNSAALQSLYSGPGKDAETIVQDLGAILTDIRQMGDMGIQKWARP